MMMSREGTVLIFVFCNFDPFPPRPLDKHNIVGHIEIDSLCVFRQRIGEEGQKGVKRIYDTFGNLPSVSNKKYLTIFVMNRLYCFTCIYNALPNSTLIYFIYL